jgi:hypothetical protein
MVKTALAVVALGVCANLGQTPKQPVALATLTVPEDRLPSGCRLETRNPSTSRQYGIRYGALTPTRNPWIGSDQLTLATIVERINGAPAVPDGPPLSPKDANRYLLKLADGVEEGYAAVYTVKDSDVVIVFALRFDVPPPLASRTRAARAGTIVRIEQEGLVVTADGPPGACASAIEQHLRSVLN